MDETSSVGREQVLPPVIPTVIPTLIALVWVTLTWRTGLTYHFMPLAVAASGAVTAGLLSDARMARATVGRLAAWSLLVVAFSWGVMVLVGFDPAGTFVSGQPGGVIGEVVAFALLGAFGSVQYALRH